MRTQIAGAGLLILAGILSSCSESPNRNGIRSATTVLTPIRQPPTGSQLRGAALDGGDVHKGWTLINPSLAVTAAASGCGARLESLPSPVGSATVEYRDPENALPVLTETLASFQQNQATSRYQNLVDTLNTCTNPDFHVGSATVSAKVAHSGPLDLGVENQAYAAELTAPGTNLHLGLDVFEDGTVVGCVGYTTPASTTTTALEEYAKRAVGKLETLS